MAFIGNTNTTQAFTPAIDYFSGNASTTAFTLSRPVASVAQVQAVVNNVAQNPSDAFTVSGNTITFTSAPSSGTNNIYVYYTSPITQVIAPGQSTVGTTQLQNGLTVNFADGTAAAPSITNDGDTNTGIFFPAADTIAFAEGGAEVMRIDSSGRLLVGTTTSPSSSDVKNVISATTGAFTQYSFNGGAGAVVGAAGSSTLAFYTYTGNIGAETYSERMRIDSSGNLLFNSGYGSVATAYGCRAWVNFNGTGNTNLSGTYSRTSPSTTLTVTATAHGLIVGNSVNLDFTSGTGLDGIYTVVTVADANTFTITTVASTTTSGNVTLLRNTIRASGNVSSITDNGTGSYTVNFTTAMVDTSYAWSLACNGNASGMQSGAQLSGSATVPTLLSTTAFRFNTGTTSGGTAVDMNDVSAIFIR